MIKQGILTEVNEPTNWTSSFAALKKPGKLRICIDSKDLNKALKRNHYYIKTLDDILPNLTKAKVFSVLDAKDGYHQIKLDDKSSYLTTFWSPKGRLRWLRMSSGIKPTSEEYQHKQAEILEGLKGAETIHDDVLVLGYAETTQEALENHDENLENLLKRFREKNLKLNKKKAKFRMTEVKFMRQILTADGLKPDESKVTAIRNIQTPKNVAEMQRFLGYANYLAKFLPKVSDTAKPLRNLIC